MASTHGTQLGRPGTRRLTTREEIAVDLGALRYADETSDTATYVSAWCRLNHLKEA